MHQYRRTISYLLSGFVRQYCI